MRKLIAPMALAVLCMACGKAADGQPVWKTMFPEGLHDASGKAVKPDQLKGKVVGLYFSAHWCPPCRRFTPKLVAFRDKNAKDFEIVFVSSDRSAKKQKEYMEVTKMKWLAVKWHSKTAAALKKKYGIRGIPTLVILSPAGKTITTKGRADVTMNPAKALAKWKQAAGT